MAYLGGVLVFGFLLNLAAVCTQLSSSPFAFHPPHQNPAIAPSHHPPPPHHQISQPLVPLVDEFAARLFGELDYVQEGKSAEKFQVGRFS